MPRERVTLAAPAPPCSLRRGHEPLDVDPLDRSLITVHPLGGCAMADTPDQGVVNSIGQVFHPGGPPGRVHPGLYVVDGSIVPEPLGVNPLLTITALAERAAERFLDDFQELFPRAVGPAINQPALRVGARATVAPTLSFEEYMSGYFSPGNFVPPNIARSPDLSHEFEAACEVGRSEGCSLETFLTITHHNLPALLANPASPARIVGTVVAPMLAKGRLGVTNGSFTLLEHQPDLVETWYMKYEMDLRSAEGDRYRIEGFKVIHEGPAHRAWHDTTTLYVTVLGTGGGAEPTEIGRGVIRITVADFLDLLRSMRIDHVASRRRRERLRLRFLALFARSLRHLYGGVLDEPGRFPSLPAPPQPIPRPR